MSELPASPCCPSSYLTQLSQDGSLLLCMGCNAVVRADRLESPGLGAPVDELMRAPITLPDHGGGRCSGRFRRPQKPGEKEWIQQRRQSRRGLEIVQEPLGRPDQEREPLSRQVGVKLDSTTATEVETAARALEVSVPEFVRRALNAYLGDATRDAQGA